MAVIRLAGTKRSVPASPVRSVLVSLQAEGIPIETLCGGRARCGRCAVRVVSGTELLRPPRPAELERLRAIRAAPDVRLACQSFPRGDIVIEILSPGTSPAGSTV